MKERCCEIKRDSNHAIGLERLLNQGDFYAKISHNPRNPRENKREIRL
jgi:hypothetical protein